MREVILFLMGLVVTLLFSVPFFLTSLARRRRYIVVDEFYQELRRQLERGWVSDIGDVREIQRAVAEKHLYPIFAARDLAPLLRVLLLDISSAPDTQVEKLGWEEKRKKEYEFVKTLLSKELEEKPFSILPEKEQVLATRLKESIETQRTQEAVEYLRELAISVGTKLQAAADERTRGRRLTLWSVVFGAIGLLLVIITNLIPAMIALVDKWSGNP